MSDSVSIFGRESRTGKAGALELSTGRPGGADILTFGFGTTVAMWVIGYFSRIPPVLVPSPVLLLLLIACILAGGFGAGAATGRGWRAGLASGLLTAVLNMLVLGSLLGGSSANRLAPGTFWWIPGALAAGALLGTAGGALGRALAGGWARPETDWTDKFAAVAAAATLMLLMIGGVVTSENAGLAVVDWPNTSGYFMFLYPLSRMTGGIYFEHAHRLFASLVGLTTLVLAIYLQRADRRPWVRGFAFGALGLVILQGILGGLRVTGHFTGSDSPADTHPSLALAVVHGITGQLFFASLVALAAFTSRTWRSDRAPTRTRAAGTDRGLGAFLVAAIILQLVLGAVLRHTSKGLVTHVTMATFVVVLVVASGARAAGIHRGQRILERIGVTLLLVVAMQVLLGVLSLIVNSLAAGLPQPPRYQVVVTTAHQTFGAVLLGTAVLLAVWNRRLLEAESEGSGGQ